MKAALAIALLTASGFAMSEDSIDRFPEPEVPPFYAPVPPRGAMPEHPVTPQFDNQELADLLRAQTNAIKSLSRKVDSLEERMHSIENAR